MTGTGDEPVAVVRSQFVLAPFEAWVALAAVYAGLANFLPLPTSGSSRAVYAAVPALAAVWSLLYALGGIGVLIGLGRRSPRVEGAGLALLASGLAVAALAAIYVGAAVVPTLTLQGLAVVACVVRLRLLGRLS